ncbi:none [Leptomonas seymouri]|uniref:None n=1 Tax=Leptomonas seymouri TaxID=5684 RepID=A0A0N0P5D8_LEPSE|nr:none [Leptomonas seymouri]|eukprot:KPI85877.1 none [Leptomonas seymouri]
MSSEQIEGVIEHITYTKGVLGVVVCTTEGEPIRDSFQNLDRSLAQSYAVMAADLARQAACLFEPMKTHSFSCASESLRGAPRKKSVAAPPALPICESTVELLRVRTLLHEVIVRCSSEFLLVVVQEPVD